MFQNFTGIYWQHLNNLYYDDLVHKIDIKEFMGFSFKTPIPNIDKLNWFSYSNHIVFWIYF